MVINYTDVKKTNNHLSPKESLNSDGHHVGFVDVSVIDDQHCLNFL
jgi:hypothetical protein